MARKPKTSRAKKKTVDTLKHARESKRTNIPTAETQSFMSDEEATPKPMRYPRNPDLDPQLVWRGKDEQDGDDLIVDTVPIYIQEQVHPRAIIADIQRRSQKIRQKKREKGEAEEDEAQFDLDSLWGDFNGLGDPEAEFEFYSHEKNWTNRMILGDSLMVMNSLANKEALKGQVQCIYFDPPYGIKFNSNWQVSTKSRDVKDGKNDQVAREPEVVKAFRDTWSDGIHSYLTYLRDRLVVARDLLAESGSVFVQIGDENVHLVRALMDEVFGKENFVSIIAYRTTTGLGQAMLDKSCDYILWAARNIGASKYRELFRSKGLEDDIGGRYRRVQISDLFRRPLTSEERGTPTLVSGEARIFRHDNLTSQSGSEMSAFLVQYEGKAFSPGKNYWKTNKQGIQRLRKANRLAAPTTRSLNYVRFLDDFAVSTFNNIWTDTQTGAFTDQKIYVVQTNAKVIERCILMATDPGDLVLDPTCGSGTTAFVSEQWGRRWITIDTSRVSLALARQRLMAGRFPYYHLQDSAGGAKKEAEITGKPPATGAFQGRIRQGFVYERLPHITLKSIANNAEIDVIWEKWQETLGPLLDELNAAREQAWEVWEVPRHAADLWSDAAVKAHEKALPLKAELLQALEAAQGMGGGMAGNLKQIREKWNAEARKHLSRIEKEIGKVFTLETLPDVPGDPWTGPAVDLHRNWWEARRGRQKEIDACIARNADVEFLYDKPYEDTSKVRVTGPFTVESLSPHRLLSAGEDDPALLEALREEAEEAGHELPERTQSIRPQDKAPSGDDDFVQVVLDNMKKAGVQNTKKKERLVFSELKPWAGGRFVHAEGRYREGEKETGQERKAAVFIGPEYGTVSWSMVRDAAKEAVELFDTLIVCGFAFEPMVNEDKLASSFGKLTVLKARMNQDLHMADQLRNTGAGNLFVVFGEPDISVETDADGMVTVEILGVDIFDPTSGEVRASPIDDIACWFIDTDYSGDSFFVRHAYFTGGNDPYEKLRRTLQAEIDEDAWQSMYSPVSNPFPKPESGQIAVKVINHYGDEVMKVYRVE